MKRYRHFSRAADADTPPKKPPETKESRAEAGKLTLANANYANLWKENPQLVERLNHLRSRPGRARVNACIRVPLALLLLPLHTSATVFQQQPGLVRACVQDTRWATCWKTACVIQG